jgi:hypothetical protein
MIRNAALILVTVSLALTSACGSGEDDGTPSFPRVISLGDGEVFPAITNSSLAVGPNRVTMSLVDRDDAPISGAIVHLRYYDLNDGEPRLTAEMDARFVPVTFAYVDEQSGGETTDTGEGGAYVSSVSFDRAGDWGVEVTVTRDGETLEPVPYRFTVRDESTEPGIGDPAPPSVQQVLATAGSIEEIDSSHPVRTHMHDITIADALSLSSPTVIAFATPAFCRTRTCAPVMDTVMDPLYEEYKDRARFIHVEPYVLRDLRAANVQNPVPATLEWRLHSEPWIFVVGRDGRIAGKFEGIMSLDEVEAALIAAVGQP